MSTTLPKPRPAHAPGPTFATYIPNGRRLISVGSNDAIRVFQTGSDGEPVNIDDAGDSNMAVAATNSFFVSGTEDGSVRKFSLETDSFEELLVRSSGCIRDLALSKDGQWLAVASDELQVKVVNTTDMDKICYLREQQKPAKHVSFDPDGRLLTVSCSDGTAYVYARQESAEHTEFNLLKKVEGLIRALETDDEANSQLCWHPDGRAFAAAKSNGDVQIMSKGDWEMQRTFRNEHKSDVTALAWCPNGALLATADKEQNIVVWQTKTQTVLQRLKLNRGYVLSFTWHPTQNIMSYTTNEGELYIHEKFLNARAAPLLEQWQAAPFFHNSEEHEPLMEITGNARPASRDARTGEKRAREERAESMDTLDELDGLMHDEDSGFVDDDDGAGYGEAPTTSRKRPRVDSDAYQHPSKRQSAPLWRPRMHASFQPGCTPWRGNRRYLCFNLIGHVYTVDQETHHSVTVESHDRSVFNKFTFSDPNKYDKAFLTEIGVLFSSPPTFKEPATVHFRPHQYWTHERPDWRTTLPLGESVQAIALSESYAVVTSSTGFVRVYTLFGTPVRVWRQKSSPVVTCATWKNYVLTMGNGPIGGNGKAALHYSIFNVSRDETCQNEDTVALGSQEEVRSVFFSDSGDPFIYDADGVLLVCLHWRTPGQAQWVPVLDTRSLARRATGQKEETYWPVGVSDNRFYCLILKGGDLHPTQPAPETSDFEFEIPIAAPLHQLSADQENSEQAEIKTLEEAYNRAGILNALLGDQIDATQTPSRQQTELLSKQELDANKTLLRLLAAECQQGEERGMKALEIIRLMRDDDSSSLVEASKKIAVRFGRNVLFERIEELAEARLMERSAARHR